MKALSLLIATVLIASVGFAKTTRHLKKKTAKTKIVKNTTTTKRKPASADFTRTCRLPDGTNFYVKFDANRVVIESGLNIDSYHVIEQPFEGNDFPNLVANNVRTVKLSVDPRLTIIITVPDADINRMTGTVHLTNKEALEEVVLENTTDLEMNQVRAEAQRVLNIHQKKLLSQEGLSARCVQQ